VIPVRYELDFYVLSSINSVLKELSTSFYQLLHIFRMVLIVNTKQ
jgi:hypothetical protein